MKKKENESQRSKTKKSLLHQVKKNNFDELTPKLDILCVMLEEYKEIRAEINLKQSNTQAINNFALIIIAGAFGAFGLDIATEKIYSYILLISPLFLGILGLCFAYEVNHIVVASAFINNDIRLRITKLLNVDSSNVLPWEDFKSFNSTKLDFVFDLARWLIYILPSFFFVIMSFVWISKYNLMVWAPLIIIDIFLHFFLIFCFFFRKHQKNKLFHFFNLGEEERGNYS